MRINLTRLTPDLKTQIRRRTQTRIVRSRESNSLKTVEKLSSVHRTVDNQRGSIRHFTDRIHLSQISPVTRKIGQIGQGPIADWVIHQYGLLVGGPQAGPNLG